MAKRVVASDTAVAPVDDKAPVVRSLSGLREAENECRRCPLYKNATQAVPGEGPSHAKVMLVGEQPGDKEDLAGKPFVGPAGRLLDQALADAGIPRNETFVTNAVKHFKFEPRGKRRKLKVPDAFARLTEEEADKRVGYAQFVKDLRVVARLVFKKAA